MTGGTARAAPSPARRAARPLAGRPPARPLPSSPARPPGSRRRRRRFPGSSGREGAEAAPAGRRLPLLTPRARGKPAPPLSAPGPAVRSRLALFTHACRPLLHDQDGGGGRGPAARGSRAGLAGEARANPTGGGAPGGSMACCPPPPPGSPSRWGAVAAGRGLDPGGLVEGRPTHST